MTVRRSLFLPLVFITQISGCAVWYSMQSDLDARIDQLTEAQDYTTALETLEQIRPNHPHYAQLQHKKQHILRLIKDYETQIIQNAANETKQQHWQAAEKFYTEGIEKLPHSESLAKAYQDFSQERQQQLQLITFQISLSKAEWLLKITPLQQQLQQLSLTAQQPATLTNQLAEHSGELYRDLVHCGQVSMQNAALDLAAKCFTTAMQLNPAATDIAPQLVELEKRRTTNLTTKGEELLANSRQALQKDDLHSAYKIFKKIPAQDKQNSAVIEFRKELSMRISHNVKQGIEMGRKLYSQGDIERALAIWNNVRELEPNNEQLDNHIERAQHVLNKLKSLKKNEPVIAPPSTKKDNS